MSKYDKLLNALQNANSGDLFLVSWEGWDDTVMHNVFRKEPDTTWSHLIPRVQQVDAGYTTLGLAEDHEEDPWTIL